MPTTDLKTSGPAAMSGGFLRGAWFGLRNFVGGGLVAAAFGVAIAVVCLAIGLVLRALLEAVLWLVRLV